MKMTMIGGVTDDQASLAYARTTTLDFLQRCSEPVAGIYRLWESKCHRDRPGNQLPARADFDPVEMKAWLPGITLVDVQHHPRRLVYRLVSSRSVELRQRDVTGLTVEEAYHGSSLADVLENYRLAVDDQKVVYDWDATPSPDGLRQDVETLMLPLSSDGKLVDMVMVYIETRVPRQQP
jgi:hypothetical protein